MSRPPRLLRGQAARQARGWLAALRRGAWVSAAVCLAAAGCRRSDPGSLAAASSSAAPLAPSALPADHLLPGELREGPTSVAGITLPVDFRVERAFEGETHIVGPARAEQVASYLRRRLDAPQSEIGPSRTLFPKARPRGGSGPDLRVEVNDQGSNSEIVVTVIKPPVIDPTLSEEERWRRAGLNKGGGLVNPQQAF